MAASTPAAPARRLSRYALVLFPLTVAAAVISFVQGNWWGIVWVLLAGVTSNLAWYYARRARLQARDGAR